MKEKLLSRYENEMNDLIKSLRGLDVENILEHAEEYLVKKEICFYIEEDYIGGGLTDRLDEQNISLNDIYEMYLYYNDEADRVILEVLETIKDKGISQ